MIRKLSIALLCLLLTGVATVAVVLGISSSNKGSGSQINNTDPTGSTSGSGSSSNGGSTDGSSSSNNSNGSSNGGSTNGSSSNGGAVAAHTCEFVYYSTIPATCTAQGYDLYICSVYSNCPQTDKRNTKKVLGHDYKYTQHDATCTSDWSQTGVCSRCGDIDSQTVSGTAKPHDYDWTIVKAATCTSDGLKTGQCKSCTATDTQPIPATGHNYSWTVTKAVSCTDDGAEYGTCSDCGAKDSRTVPATGHRYGAYVVTTPHSCTQDEIKTATCDNCGDEISKISKYASHYFSSATYKELISPTCTDEGKFEQTCSECGYSYTGVLRANGHEFFNKTYNIGNCTKKTSVTRHCKNCSYSDRLELGYEHSMVGGVCTLCGEKFKPSTSTFDLDFKYRSDDTECTDFGTVKLEFDILLVELVNDSKYNSWYLRKDFEIYAIQSYTENGQPKQNRIKARLNVDDEGWAGSFEFELLNIKTGDLVTFESWLDSGYLYDESRLFFTFNLSNSSYKISGGNDEFYGRYGDCYIIDFMYFGYIDRLYPYISKLN